MLFLLPFFFARIHLLNFLCKGFIVYSTIPCQSETCQSKKETEFQFADQKRVCKPQLARGPAVGIGVARGAKGPCLPKFLENIVILPFQWRFSKPNGVIRLKSNILVSPNFLAGYATDSRVMLLLTTSNSRYDLSAMSNNQESGCNILKPKPNIVIAIRF